MEKETMAARIRRIREERGMNGAELARIIGVTSTCVWNWENSGTRPRPGTLSSLARALGVSTETLLSGNGSGGNESAGATKGTTVAEIIENAKSQIAAIAGLVPDRVKVHVEFATE